VSPSWLLPSTLYYKQFHVAHYSLDPQYSDPWPRSMTRRLFKVIRRRMICTHDTIECSYPLLAHEHEKNVIFTRTAKHSRRPLMRKVAG